MTNEKSNPALAIVQLSKQEDLILTAKAIEDFKRTHPQMRTVLVCHAKEIQGIEFLFENCIDQIYPIDINKLVHSQLAAGLKGSFYSLNETITQLNNEQLDVIVNLSQNQTSAYFMSLIEAKFKVGPYMTKENAVFVEDKWSQVLRTSVLRGNLNPYNVVDLYRNVIGLKSQPLIATQDLGRENFIVINPFSSNEKSSWRPEKWVEVIYKTLKDNREVSVKIVGDRIHSLKSQLLTENPLLKQFSTRVENLTGKLSNKQFLDVIKPAKAFLTHHSKMSLIASFSNTPTILISLGSSNHIETTPYNNNTYVVSPNVSCYPCAGNKSCATLECHHDIPYQAITTLTQSLVKNGEISTKQIFENITSFHLKSIAIEKSSISTQQTLKRLDKGLNETNEAMRAIYNLAWSFVINDTDVNLDSLKLTDQSQKEFENAVGALEYFYELSEFGKKYSRYILEELAAKSPNIESIKKYSSKIDEIDQFQKMIINRSHLLSPLIEYHSMRKAYLVGENIVDLTESSFFAFDEASQLSSVLFELMQMTLQQNKQDDHRKMINPK